RHFVVRRDGGTDWVWDVASGRRLTPDIPLENVPDFDSEQAVVLLRLLKETAVNARSGEQKARARWMLREVVQQQVVPVLAAAATQPEAEQHLAFLEEALSVRPDDAELLSGLARLLA